MTHRLDPLTFPLHGTRLIEASAGTGKTYTIAALYLRLILGHGGESGYRRRLTPPEILVVTFTNAATEALRERIRNRLNEAAAVFRERSAGDPFLANLRGEFDDTIWLNCARVLDQAAQWMDEAAIYTIHSWSQRMLRQHAFDSGSLFDLTLEPEDRNLLENAAFDYWRHHFYPQPIENLAELIALTRCNTPHDLLARVRPLLNAQIAPSDDPFVMLDQRRRTIEAARRSWAPNLDAAIDALEHARADKTLNGNKYRKASLSKWLDALTNWVKHDGPLPDEKAREKLSYSGLQAGLNKNKTIPEHPAFGVFDDLAKKLADLKVDNALFAHAAREIDRRFQTEKQRRAQMGYDDLLTLLNDALHRPGGQRLARVIKRQFPVVLIDEFQDTDPVQYSTFSKIYLNQPDTGLFMIGDPKQAIYAFRGADIFTYLFARGAAAGKHYTLGTNYRSTEGLVQAANQIFSRAATYRQGAFLFGDQIPFDTVTAHGRTDQLIIDGKPIKSMHFGQLPQTEPVSKTGANGYLNQMAEAFASEIVHILNLAHQSPPKAGFTTTDGTLFPLRPADIAVLVRDVYEASAIRQALYKRRLRSVYLSDRESIFTSDEAMDLLYLLNACSDPGQQGRLKAALATKVLDLPLSQLDRINKDEAAWDAQVDRFGRYQRIWQQQGVLPMLRTLLTEFDVPARLFSKPAGERSLTNLLHLAELLQTEAANLDGEPALIRWLTDQLQKPGGVLDDQILRLESDEDLVRVITIHKSKGLEYPLVFLPFVCSYRAVSKRTSQFVRYHDENGQPKGTLDPGENELMAAERERLAEDLRLLYVAVTRARYACWLGIGVMGKATKKKEVSNIHRSAFGYLLSDNEPIPTAKLSERLAQLKGDCSHITIEALPTADDHSHAPKTEKIELNPAKTFYAKVPSDWKIDSYSSIVDATGGAMLHPAATSMVQLYPGAADSPIEDQLQEPEAQWPSVSKTPATPTSIHQFPRGPQPGTFLHALLEWAAAEGFAPLAKDRQLIDHKLIQLCQRRGWGPWATVLSDWLQRFLRLPITLPENHGQMALANLAAESYQPELEFLFAAQRVDTQALDDALNAEILPQKERPKLKNTLINGMMKGFIDLAFCHEGRYYVLDYKSNHLGDDDSHYGRNAMNECMLAHRYDLQYVLYTLALHRLLKARLPAYDYQQHIGGAVYIFLRGIDAKNNGIFAHKPPQQLIEKLDSDFAGLESDHAAP